MAMASTTAPSTTPRNSRLGAGNGAAQRREETCPASQGTAPRANGDGVEATGEANAYAAALHKRLRKYTKRLGRLQRIEEAQRQGKAVERDQAETLATKESDRAKLAVLQDLNEAFQAIDSAAAKEPQTAEAMASPQLQQAVERETHRVVRLFVLLRAVAGLTATDTDRLGLPWGDVQHLQRLERQLWAGLQPDVSLDTAVRETQEVVGAVLAKDDAVAAEAGHVLSYRQLGDLLDQFGTVAREGGETVCEAEATMDRSGEKGCGQ